jgi:hypothetical protein
VSSIGRRFFQLPFVTLQKCSWQAVSPFLTDFLFLGSDGFIGGVFCRVRHFLFFFVACTLAKIRKKLSGGLMCVCWCLGWHSTKNGCAVDTGAIEQVVEDILGHQVDERQAKTIAGCCGGPKVGRVDAEGLCRPTIGGDYSILSIQAATVALEGAVVVPCAFRAYWRACKLLYSIDSPQQTNPYFFPEQRRATGITNKKV